MKEGSCNWQSNGQHSVESMEVARNLKDTGLPIADISKATGLTDEEINGV